MTIVAYGIMTQRQKQAQICIQHEAVKNETVSLNVSIKLPFRLNTDFYIPIDSESASINS